MDFLDPELERELNEMVAQLELPAPPTKSCNGCGESDISKFRKHVRGPKTYLSRKCKTCVLKQNNSWKSKNPHKVREHWKTIRFRISKQRKNPQHHGKFILEDCKHSDRKKGRENNLTLEFVMKQISKECQYCKTNEGRISLDRIDNSKGHIQDNVVPACLRCNYTRGGMPYLAWLEIVPAMETARTCSLFSDWKYRHFDFSN